MSIYAILHNELEHLSAKNQDFDNFCTPNMLYYELELGY